MPEHSHGESEAAGRILRGLVVAIVITVVALLVEAIGAVLSRSLSVTVDAVHNVPDLFAFVASYIALAATARGRTDEQTFGSHRLEVFAALLNAFVILTTGAVFAYPAVLGLLHGTTLAGPVDPVWILAAAIPTLFLRGGAAIYLGRIPRRARDLNVRSVLLHLATDVVIAATLLVDAAWLLLSPSSEWIDSAAALVIAGILVYESIPLFRGGWEVLTERVPSGISVSTVSKALGSAPHVREVHDLHVWSLCPTLVCMTAHVRVDEMSVSEGARVTEGLRRLVEEEFGIVHAVFELEAEPFGSSSTRPSISPAAVGPT